MAPRRLDTRPRPPSAATSSPTLGTRGGTSSPGRSISPLKTDVTRIEGGAWYSDNSRVDTLEELERRVEAEHRKLHLPDSDDDEACSSPELERRLERPIYPKRPSEIDVLRETVQRLAEGANAQLHAEQTHDAAMAALTVKCSRLQQAFHTLSKVAVEQLDALRDEVTTLARGLEDVRAKAVMKTGLERVADNPFERVADPAKFSTLQAQQTGTEREVEMLKEALKMQQRTINKLTKQVEALRDERDGIEEGTGSPSRSLVSRSAAPSIAGTDSPSSVRSSVRSSAAASTKASLRSLSMPKAPAPPPVPPSRAAPRRPASAAASSRTSSGGSSPAASERSAPQKSEDLREQIRAARLAAARTTTVAAGRASPRTSSPLVPR